MSISHFNTVKSRNLQISQIITDFSNQLLLPSKVQKTVIPPFQVQELESSTHLPGRSWNVLPDQGVYGPVVPSTGMFERLTAKSTTAPRSYLLTTPGTPGSTVTCGPDHVGLSF